MNFDQIVERFIRDYRQASRDEMDEFRKLPSLRRAIHHATLCHRLPSMKRHAHQYRIPGAALREAERRLQHIADQLRRSRGFQELHDKIAQEISSIRNIGSLVIYDIAHRIGAYLNRPPKLVFLHRGTAIGARQLGFRGTTLDPRKMPAAFSRLSPAEIEDCLCIFKTELGGLTPRGLRLSNCTPVSVRDRRGCVIALTNRRAC